jgi:DNA-directed RNA polymerase specialized sigma24 family protein
MDTERTTSPRIERLARLAAAGMATDAEANELMTAAMDQARAFVAIAVRDGKVRRMDMDDVVQETLLKLWSRIRTYAHRRGAFGGMVAVVAASCIADYQRWAYDRNVNRQDALDENDGNIAEAPERPGDR